MQGFRVPLTIVQEVINHPNADRLDLVTIYGWTVVAGRDQYKPGDVVVYVPVDSVLPELLEAKLFPEGSKIKLHNHRVKSIKIRGVVSQGMLINPKDFNLTSYDIESNVADALQITKYEPPATELPLHMNVKTSKKIRNENFHEYDGPEHWKYHNRTIENLNLEVVITEKLHGTQARYGQCLNEPNTWWKKLLSKFGLLPTYEFCWGSRRVQIQGKLFHKGYYDEDVYTKIAKQYDLKNRIPKGYALYGEIVGHKIQANYTYGCEPGEHKFYVFDVMKDGKYLDFNDAFEFCGELGFEFVPFLWQGEYSHDIVEQLKVGDSLIGGQVVREGVVIKPSVEMRHPTIGRLVLKAINDEYYLMNGTDFH